MSTDVIHHHRPIPVADVTWTAPTAPEAPFADDTFLAAADRAGRALPATTAAAITGLGGDLAGVGALVLRGLPVGDLPATPDRPDAHVTKDHVSELTLLTVARLLGEPVGYLPEHGGDIVQNIIPTASDASRQTSTSSKVQLAFHTETAFHPHKPRFLALLCLKGDPDAATTLCSIDDVLPLLTPAARRLLSEPRFHTRADESFGGGPGAAFGEPIAVLAGDPEHPVLTFDGELTSGIDDDAHAALDELNSLIERHHTSVVLQAGDLLVVDNHRCVHGRSPFAARFDGTDRWLQRSFVVADLAPSSPERVGRIITTRFD